MAICPQFTIDFVATSHKFSIEKMAIALFTCYNADMQRDFYDKLSEWKASKRRKPLMVIGARQVGKTHTISEFCLREYPRAVIVNLLERDDVVSMYDSIPNAQSRFERLLLLLGLSMDDPDQVLFIDEAQESEAFIADLKFLHERHPNFNIIAAGSLLGIRLKRFKKSFPVGQVSFLKVYPMSFKEFMAALGESRYIAEIRNCFEANNPMQDALHQLLLEKYRLYLCIGGMPEAVADFIENGQGILGFNRTLLDDIVIAYSNDMNKYVLSHSEALKIAAAYASIPAQLGNNAGKFQYSNVEKGGRKRNLETAIDWLNASQLSLQCHKVSKPEKPLKSYADPDFFKLYLSDVGILTNTLEISFSDLLGDCIGEHKGPITENYVAQELACKGIPLFYWQSQGNAEIDFLLANESGVIPVEVKAGTAVTSKSLRVYNEKFRPPYAVRVSARNFGFEGGIKSVPLYAVFCLAEQPCRRESPV